jgi:hypothetical protein
LVLWISKSFFVFQLTIVLSHFSFSENRNDYFLNYLNENSIFLIEIIDYPQEKENSIQILAKVSAVDKVETCGKNFGLFKERK